jgi:hypothetical protein
VRVPVAPPPAPTTAVSGGKSEDEFQIERF